MEIFAIGLNHRTAPLEVRERMAFSSTQAAYLLDRLRSAGRVKGCCVLVTCNRTEVYAVADRVEAEKARADTLALLESLCGPGQSGLRRYLYCHRTRKAVVHLFRVASALDSMVLGEPQILGQVKRAYDAARAGGTTDRVLNTLFQRAIRTGKRVRTETRVGRNSVSVSHVAVELARRVLGSLEGKMVLVIGAGKMSELAARYLAASGVPTVIITNRSYDRAQALAAEIGGRAVRFDDFARFLPTADIVICGTSAAHYVVRLETARAALAGKEKGTLFIDLAVPRDVDPRVRELDGVTLYDVDDLQATVESNLRERRRLALDAERIVKEESAEFSAWLESLPAVPTITAIKERAAAVAQAELDKALRKLPDLTGKEREAVKTLARSIANKLTHPLVANLRRSAGSRDGQALAKAIGEMLE